MVYYITLCVKVQQIVRNHVGKSDEKPTFLKEACCCSAVQKLTSQTRFISQKPLTCSCCTAH